MKRVSFNIDDELLRKLDEFAEANGMTRSEAIRLAIEELLGRSKYEPPMDALLFYLNKIQNEMKDGKKYCMKHDNMMLEVTGLVHNVINVDKAWRKYLDPKFNLDLHEVIVETNLWPISFLGSQFVEKVVRGEIAPCEEINFQPS